MRDPVGMDNRASKRVPAGKISAALETGTKLAIATHASKVTKPLLTQYNFPPALRNKTFYPQLKTNCSVFLLR
jgi:hypothetical protein